MKWDYKKWEEDVHFIPDIIWASPTMENLNTSTQEDLLSKTLEIISFFKKLNPKLLFVIDNPKAMTSNDIRVKNVDENTTYECLHDSTTYRSTDFFSNFILDVKSGTCNVPKLDQERIGNSPFSKRYRVSPKMIRAILTKFKEVYNN